MLDIYTGPPGSGKSLDMARRILRAIRGGQNVICNTEIVLPDNLASKSKNLFCMENKDITPQFLYDFEERYHEPRKEKQTLVVIDECQLKFSQAFMTKDLARLWLEFFSQHRKRGFDILLVTPSARYGVVREIRDNLESEVSHLKLSNYPAKSLILMVVLLIIQLSPIEVFMRITKWRGLPSNKYQVRRLFLYNPKYAKIYDTYKIQETSLKKPAPPPVEPAPVVIDADLLKPPESVAW